MRLVDPKTGKEIEITDEEFMEALYGGKVSVTQNVRDVTTGEVLSSQSYPVDVNNEMGVTIQAAENGSVDAMAELCDYYQFQCADPDAKEKLFYWNGKIADRGMTTFVARQGVFYAIGLGTRAQF